MCFEVSAQASEVEKREGSLFIREFAADGGDRRERIGVSQGRLEADAIDLTSAVDLYSGTGASLQVSPLFLRCEVVHVTV